MIILHYSFNCFHCDLNVCNNSACNLHNNWRLQLIISLIYIWMDDLHWIFQTFCSVFLFNQVLLYNLHTHLYVFLKLWHQFLVYSKSSFIFKQSIENNTNPFFDEIFFSMKFYENISLIYKLKYQTKKKSTKKNQLKNQSSTWKILGTY